MKKASKIIWGVVLIAVGMLFALNALNITNINIFFDGWWTLFIIIPCTVGIFTEKEKTGNIIGLLIGVLLLLCCLGVIDFSLLWKLIVPGIIVIIGIKLVFGGIFGNNRANEIFDDIKSNGKVPNEHIATFSGCDVNYDGEIFNGAELTAIFGGVECNLKNAIIEKDCAIKLTAIFGGVDITVPDNVNVKVTSNSIFGGISNKTVNRVNTPTLYITGTCVFGGAEIK